MLNSHLPGTSHSLAGNVNNPGLTDAKSMIVTVGSPAKAVEPYARSESVRLQLMTFRVRDYLYRNRPVIGTPRHYLER